MLFSFLTPNFYAKIWYIKEKYCKKIHFNTVITYFAAVQMSKEDLAASVEKLKRKLAEQEEGKQKGKWFNWT